MRILTRLGAVIEEPDRTYLAETDTDGPLKSLQAASCTYRIALGPRAGQKLLTLQSLPSQVTASTPVLRVNAHGFSLHAAPAVLQTHAIRRRGAYVSRQTCPARSAPQQLGCVRNHGQVCPRMTRRSLLTMA